jgi:TfoX/Sxy family transcriptional regulator of competence genes
VPDDTRVEVKPMFANLGAFVNGNMFMGLFGPDIGVKLPAPELDELMSAGGGPFGPSERPMSGYVTLPADLAPQRAHEVVDAALAYVATMPPKAAKKPKKAKSSE